MPVEESQEYYRGKVDATLTEHGKHFDRINGSIERSAEALIELRMVVQRLADSAESDRATARVTAIALKEADEARRLRSEEGWTQFQRALVVVGALVALASIVLPFFHR
jgi:hypothetical protein